MDTIKVGIIQQNIGADVEQNRQKLAGCIREVAAKGAQLVVLALLLSGGIDREFLIRRAHPWAFNRFLRQDCR